MTTDNTWLLAHEPHPSAMLAVALRTVRRTGTDFPCVEMPREKPWEWLGRQLQQVRLGKLAGMLLCCREPEAACCMANKVPGVRAIHGAKVAGIRRAMNAIAPQVVVVDPEGWTFYELKEMLRVCHGHVTVEVPPLAQVIQEHEAHAHR